MVIKAVFLDFDGTVSDAKRIAHDSVVKALSDFGFDFDDKVLRKSMGMKTRLILKELGISIKNVEKVRKRFYKYFIEYADNGEIKPCVSLEPLWELKKKYPLFVISNSELKFLEASIKTLNIGGLFDGVYGVEKKYDKNEILERLFKRLKIKPGEAIYVGDRFSDIEFARKAGCFAVAIHNKCAWSTLSEIKREKPDFIIKNFRELKKVIRKIDSI